MVHRITFALVLASILTGALFVALPALPARSADPTDDVVTATSAEMPRYVVYYFHGDRRCATCRKLEAYSEEAITGGFADELERGVLAFRIINLDEERHEHFVQDFQLTNKSVVVVEYREGAVARFENLTDVWRKVRDKEAFLDYVRTDTRAFIGQD
jgi:hypothetical protein